MSPNRHRQPQNERNRSNHSVLGLPLLQGSHPLFRPPPVVGVTTPAACGPQVFVEGGELGLQPKNLDVGALVAKGSAPASRCTCALTPAGYWRAQAGHPANPISVEPPCGSIRPAFQWMALPSEAKRKVQRAPAHGITLAQPPMDMATHESMRRGRCNQTTDLRLSLAWTPLGDLCMSR